MRNKKSIFLGFLISILAWNANFSWVNGLSFSSVKAISNLDGRILLQVESHGEAWYVNPLNSQRYYLGRPSDALALMRQLGLGISNADLAVFNNIAPRRLAGRILLQVQAQGQAYYVNPTNLRLYYLGRPTDAFGLMKSQGLGISNHDLALIPLSSSSVVPQIYVDTTVPTTLNTGISLNATTSTIHNFLFKYKNNNYEIFQNFSSSLYQSYATTPKVYTYSSNNAPSDLRNSFYGLFLTLKTGDSSLDDLIGQLRALAVKNNWTDDQLLEFTISLVQYIPYDHAKLSLSDNRNTNPYFPYETLYLDRGVCSDKTFLAVSLMRRLGYGAAILDFPDLNHSAAGIACPLVDSINGSGYCYVETTNYFSFGIIPQSINSGQAQSSDNQFNNLFDSSILGTIEIYQKTTGKTYQGVAATRAQVANLALAKNELTTKEVEINDLQNNITAQETNLTSVKTQMDDYYKNGQISQYNSLVASYNVLVNNYNLTVNNYQSLVDAYNIKVNNFNQNVNDFYQK